MNDLQVNCHYGLAWSNKTRGEIIPQELRHPHVPVISEPVLKLDVIPKPGWGSYQWRYDHSIPRTAVEHGASLIDTAEGYGFGRVEYELGVALSGLNCLVATKVSTNHYTAKATEGAVKRSIVKLGRTPVFQVHWPAKGWEICLATLAERQRHGDIQYIGVSNFSLWQLQKAQSIASISCVQLPLWALSDGVMEYLRGFTVIAHSPVRSPGNRDLLWCTANGVIAIPGTNNIDHLRSNLCTTM